MENDLERVIAMLNSDADEPNEKADMATVDGGAQTNPIEESFYTTADEVSWIRDQSDTTLDLNESTTSTVVAWNISRSARISNRPHFGGDGNSLIADDADLINKRLEAIELEKKQLLSKLAETGGGKKAEEQENQNDERPTTVATASPSSRPGSRKLITSNIFMESPLNLPTTSKGRNSLVITSTPKQTKSAVHSGDTSSSEDDFERHHDEGPRLSESGRALRRSLSAAAGHRASKADDGADAVKVKTPASADRNKLQKKAQETGNAVEATPPDMAEVFDATFGIRIRTPKISSSAFAAFAEGMKKVRTGQLKPNTTHSGDWITMGVVVGKTEVKKSVNKNEYLVWTISDLKNCQETVRVLLFGECVSHWKLPLSTVIALMSPQCSDGDSKRKETQATLKVSKLSQVLVLGSCPDFGYCKGVKKDGAACGNFVNLSQGNHCIYHVEAAARKMAARRGAFSCVSNAPVPSWKANKQVAALCATLVTRQPAASRGLNPPPKLLTLEARGARKLPTAGASTSIAKKEIAKKENAELATVLRANATRPGSRNLIKYQTEKSLGSQTSKATSSSRAPAPNPSKSLRDFIAKKQKRELVVSGVPKLGKGLAPNEDVPLTQNSPKKKLGARSALEDAARKRAAEVLMANRLAASVAKAPRKRAAAPAKRVSCTIVKTTPAHSADHTATGQPGTVPPSKKKFTEEELKKLLDKKSTHEAELAKDDQNREATYFQTMEQKEKVETFVTTTMEVKNCDVVSCKKCDYTARSQSDLCKMQGHLIHRHKADRRFFKCRECKTRLICYTLMPTKPCLQCNGTDFERVAMRDERKVKLPEEKLELRGEERTFVNS